MRGIRIRKIFNRINRRTQKKFEYKKPKLYVVDDEKSATRGGRYIRGQYWVSSNKILINKNQNVRAIKRSIRHELAHAVTKNPAHNQKFKRVYRQIKI